MVKKFLKAFSGEVHNIHEAAYLLGFFAFVAQILALLRDRLLAHYFGPGALLDIYYSSFRIPDLIFTVVASLVASSVLVPFFQEKIEEGQVATKKFVDEVWSAFFVLLLGVSLIAFVLMPTIISWVFGSFDATMQDRIVSLSRILLLSPLFLGLSNFLSSIIQAHRRFALYALSPVLYNVGIIIGIVFLFPTFGISGVVVGVVVGSILHACIQIPFAQSIKLFPDITFPIVFSRLKNIARISLPRTLALSTTNLVVLFLVSLASRMGEGIVSIFNFAFNLQSGPLSIIGVSYSMAAFPTLAKLFVTGQREKFAEHVSISFRHIIFLSIPVTVLFVVLRAQIVRTVLGTGAFSWNDTRLVAASVALFVISLVAQNANLLFFRTYYASGRTKLPLIISIVSSCVTVAITYGFYKLTFIFPFFLYFLSDLLRVGDLSQNIMLVLAFGFSIGTLFNLGVFVFYFNQEFKKFFHSIKDTLFHSFASSLLGGFASYLVLLLLGSLVKANTLISVFSQGFVAGVVGLGVWFITLKLLKNKEVREFEKNIKRKIWKAETLIPEQSEI